ncbi:MAG: antirestriction protein ArdA [Oscillospiraceae bacterium]|nr:antirestriction protein ArdA [Oscillospiraceae bacterium]
MPEPERVFEAFVTNLDEYNNNELVGEYVKFPTTQEELSRICESIGVDTTDEHGQPYKELFITDYDCPAYYVKRVLGEYESLDKFNHLAALIEDLPKYDQDKLSAIVAGGCDKVNNIDDLINLTLNLDCYDFVPDATDDYSLGYYYVHEIGIYSNATR